MPMSGRLVFIIPVNVSDSIFVAQYASIHIFLITLPACATADYLRAQFTRALVRAIVRADLFKGFRLATSADIDRGSFAIVRTADIMNGSNAH
jgi:hypothetical protein